ncbi:MAG TPA: efflux transporter outer membrane subunit [Rudaea sp.]|jgi:NodT family efflux transporter outer membrane factor (OMF) lipoprotein|nr:efflux transporter outer membrane subunit [Rudaea sp.]
MSKKYTCIKCGIVAIAACLSACAVGPDYKRPSTDVPDKYKENAGWHEDWAQAQPADALKRGAWWEIFSDAKLDELEAQVDGANQSLAQAEAQYRQAAALVSQARSAFWPTLGVSASATRSGRYGNSGNIIGNGGTVVTDPTGTGTGTGTTTTTTTPTTSGARISTVYSLPLQASWEPDLWGKVRRSVEQQAGNAQASEATLESTRLSLHAELATDYFQLRILDEQKRLLDDTVDAYRKSLQLTQNQYNVGVAARADVVQADTQLKTAQVQAIDLGVQRTQLEHAIALLIGKTPAEFSLEPTKFEIKPPAIPVGVPSQLLQRRPDVAVAERQAMSANAQIGVAEAAWFPTLNLQAEGGYQSSSFSKWLTAPSRFWSIGPQLAETLFDGGLRHAQSAQARAAYDAAAANYREVSLAAFQNVEDQLSALRILEAESAAQDDAVAAAELALKIALNQYRAGTVSYINVVTAQTSAFSNERNSISILGNRLNYSVGLVKAIGGGWDETQLPAPHDIDSGSQAPKAAVTTKD